MNAPIKTIAIITNILRTVFSLASSISNSVRPNRIKSHHEIPPISVKNLTHIIKAFLFGCKNIQNASYFKRSSNLSAYLPAQHLPLPLSASCVGRIPSLSGLRAVGVFVVEHSPPLEGCPYGGVVTL